MVSFDVIEDDVLQGLRDVDALFKLRRPTIVWVRGTDSSKSVLVSCLIHGCKPCGFRAVLREIDENVTYPYDVYFFIGNVESARIAPYFTHRLVPKEQNFNRVWFADPPSTADEKTAAEIFDFFKTRNLKAVLDLPSFTAKDTRPHAIIEGVHADTIALVKKLAERVFFTDGTIGAMIEKTASLCPSIVVECGTNRSAEADEFAWNALQKFLAEMGWKEGTNEDVCKEFFSNIVNVKVKKNASVAWADEKTDSQITFRSDVPKLNHRELPAGEFLGWTDSLDVFAVSKGAVEDVFELRSGELFTRKAIVPNLMAANERIAKESGFYFFERVVL